MVNKLTKEMFQDVIAFSFSEVGAMGPNGTVGVFRKSGEYFTVNYLSEETPYVQLKECFTDLQGCYWNGPMRNEIESLFTIIIGGDRGENTRIPEGYRHIYLDYGNHLCVKEELFSEVKEILRDKDNCEITFYWQQLLEKANLPQKIEDVIIAYRKQKEADEKFAQVLKELNENPDYLKAMEENKQNEGGIDGMLAILKEFSGIEMDFMELKQFGLRQQGLL